VPDHNTKLAGAVLVLALALLTTATGLFRPGYLTSDSYLSGLIFLQLLIAAIWNFHTRFFPFLLVGFLWAGMGALPFSGAWVSGRWLVLIAGALAGCVVYMHHAHHRFDSFHLIALFCSIAAVVSAVVSAFPKVALLKALSLFLLFLYASTGARLPAMGDLHKLLGSMIFWVELLVYLSAACYFILHFPIFGNPNSLGAIMGVVAVPLFFWEMLTNRNPARKPRTTLVFALSLLLLFFSQARAGILGAILACAVVCLAARSYRVLFHTCAGALALAVLAILLVPSQAVEDMPTRRAGSSFAQVFLYKGKDEDGVLQSRKSAWNETVDVITANPWFGSGFGTSVSKGRNQVAEGSFSSNSGNTREHGDSYLAILEGVGLLGVLPFLILVLMFATRALKFLLRMGRTGRLSHVGVPLAMILVSGFVHALFEDWLFAVGYYLCVFFWSVGFIFLDVSSTEQQDEAPVFQPLTTMNHPVFLSTP
jgi:O-antigen ligase